MATLLAKNALVMSRIAVAFALAAAWPGSLAHAQGANAKFDASVRPEFSEPVTLASKDGVLEVTLTAHQGQARLDTVAAPVQKLPRFCLYGGPRHGVQRADVGR